MLVKRSNQRGNVRRVTRITVPKPDKTVCISHRHNSLGHYFDRY
jgi:hypothetical protein